MPNLKGKKDMEIFGRLNSLEGLPNILIDIWDRCLNDEVAENEQEDIEEALESIEEGMIGLQRILTGGRKQNN